MTSQIFLFTSFDKLTCNYFSGERYASGIDWCRGQKFKVIENNVECFDFDPLVFGTASYSIYSLILITMSLLIYIFAYKR